MLCYFKTSNSRSFDDEVEFSMVAADYGDKLLQNTIPVEKYGVSLLKTAVVYGANASGKSNLLKAMAEGEAFIRTNTQWPKDEPLIHPYNKNKQINHERPTSYTFGILVDEVQYEYSFSNTSIQIIEEKLIENTGEEHICHFHRWFNSAQQKFEWLKFSESFDNLANLKQFLNKRTLFLSEVASLDEDNALRSPIVDSLFQWFLEKCIHIIEPDTPGKFDVRHSLDLIIEKDETKKVFLDLLQAVDFTIKDFKFKKFVEQDMEKIIPQTVHEIESKDGQKQPEIFDFFTEESVGTRLFVAWITPWFSAFSSNLTLIIDEFGNNMHPLLTQYLIDLFHEKSTKAQLIFSTHDVKLMQRDKIRDDQIWMVNRDLYGNSSIEPFSNYDIDDDKLLDNSYLQGVFQGVPRIDYEAVIDA